MSSAISDFQNTPAETLRGILLMVAGSLLIPLLDAVAKVLVGQYGLPAGEIAMARLAQQAVFILPLLLLFDGPSALKTPHLMLNLLRGVLLGFGGITFFIALKVMPLADATAIFFVEPMIVTLLSALVLKETVGWRRISAVLAGFLGALIVVRPSFAAFGLTALLPVAAAAFVAVYLILSRRLSRGSTPLAMHFYAGLGGAGVLALAMAVGGPMGVEELRLVWPDGTMVWLMILVTGLVGTLGHLLFLQAFRLAPASALAPFSYVEIISAVLLGQWFFGEFPDPMKWLGIAIIVLSGVYIFLRERKLARIVQPAPVIR